MLFFYFFVLWVRHATATTARYIMISSKKFHKTNENSNSIKKTLKCTVDNLPRQHISYGKLARGNHDDEGYIDFRIEEAGGCNELPKICFVSVLTNNRRSMDNRGTEKPYKYTAAEGCKTDCLTIYLHTSRSKVNSLKNGQ